MASRAALTLSLSPSFLFNSPQIYVINESGKFGPIVLKFAFRNFSFIFLCSVWKSC